VLAGGGLTAAPAALAAPAPPRLALPAIRAPTTITIPAPESALRAAADPAATAAGAGKPPAATQPAAAAGGVTPAAPAQQAAQQQQQQQQQPAATQCEFVDLTRELPQSVAAAAAVAPASPVAAPAVAQTSAAARLQAHSPASPEAAAPATLQELLRGGRSGFGGSPASGASPTGMEAATPTGCLSPAGGTGRSVPDIAALAAAACGSGSELEDGAAPEGRFTPACHAQAERGGAAPDAQKTASGAQAAGGKSGGGASGGIGKIGNGKSGSAQDCRTAATDTARPHGDAVAQQAAH